MHAALIAVAVVAVLAVGGYAILQAVARTNVRAVWTRWKHPVAAPPPTPIRRRSRLYRSRSAASFWESPTHDFWSTDRPNPWRDQRPGRRNRSA